MAQIVLENAPRWKLSIVILLFSLPCFYIFRKNINVLPGYTFRNNILQCELPTNNASNSNSDSLSWPHLSQHAIDGLLLRKECPTHAADGVSHLTLIRNVLMPERQWLRNVVGITAHTFDRPRTHSKTSPISLQLWLYDQKSYRYDAQLISIDGFNGTGPWKTKTIAAVNNKEYSREDIRMFQLPSLQHDFYLLSMRMRFDIDDVTNPSGIFLKQVRHQYEGLTKALLWSKAIYFVIIVISVVWFVRRLCKLSRPLAFLEYLLFLLGISAAVRNVPHGFLQFVADFPAEHLMEGLQGDIYYIVQFCFLILFATENFMLDKTATCSRLKRNSTPLKVIVVGGIVRLAFNACARCLIVLDPFASIWNLIGGVQLILFRIVVTSGMLFMYIIYFSYLLYRADGALNNNIIKQTSRRISVFFRLFGIALCLCTIVLFMNISPIYAMWTLVLSEGFLMISIFLVTVLYMISGMMNTERSQPGTGSTVVVSERNGDVISRYSTLMIFSFVCALMSVAKCISEEVLEYPKCFDGYNGFPVMIMLHFGTHNIWNICVVCLLYLYAPDSRKPYRSASYGHPVHHV